MSELPPEIDLDAADDVERVVLEHAPATTDRSLARRIALQILYETDSTTHPIGSVIESQLEHNSESRKVKRYSQHLVMGIMARYEQLDIIIQQYAPEWPVQQLAIIDRNILRIGLFEFGVESRTPVGVAIDEAVLLGKMFGAEGTPRFINGVLGSLARNLEEIRQLLAEEDAS